MAGVLSLSVFAGACFASAGLVVIGLVMMWALRRKPVEVEPHVIRPWLATGRINLLADPKVMESKDENAPANFVLRVEESRLVADISESPNLEIRWRQPNKREAKLIVRTYHGSTIVPTDLYRQETSAFDTLQGETAVNVTPAVQAGSKAANETIKAFLAKDENFGVTTRFTS